MHDEDRTTPPLRQPEQLELAAALAGDVLIQLHRRAIDANLVHAVDWDGWFAVSLEHGVPVGELRIEAAQYARAELLDMLVRQRRRVRSAELVPVRRVGSPVSLFLVHEPDLAALERAVDELAAEDRANEVRVRRAQIALVGEARARVRRRRRW